MAVFAKSFKCSVNVVEMDGGSRNERWEFRVKPLFPMGIVSPRPSNQLGSELGEILSIVLVLAGLALALPGDETGAGKVVGFVVAGTACLEDHPS